VSLEIKDGLVKASVCLAERYMVFANRSCRMICVASLATLEAILFAMILKETASMEQTSITPPQAKISRRLPTGITESIT
jgi:hypothetical protein